VKIAYIGSPSPLSYIPLHRLLAAGRSVVAIVVAGQRKPAAHNPKFPVLVEHSTSIASLALQYRIALIELTRDWSDAAERLVRIAPDVILVSCIGRKLPKDIVSIPRYGCFNLHPSLLPRFRGPAPVFWQFRAGVESFGITVHCVSEEFDTGDIVAQSRVTMPDGVNGREADGLFAEAGSQLIEATLRSIECGSLRRCAQSPSDATYQGLPVPDDYAVSTRWSARRMYNFICATRLPGIVFPCKVGGRIYRLTAAKSYRDSDVVRIAVEGRRVISINCSRGVVEAIYAAGTN
jgi:methionyl-tRNA formyltransferase